MSKRKFYRTVIELEVLSEEPIVDMAIGDINYEMENGHLSGLYKTKIQDKEVNGKEMAKMLQEQGSDPEFFLLDEDGNDIEE